jgi:hypothetical protein
VRPSLEPRLLLLRLLLEVLRHPVTIHTTMLLLRIHPRRQRRQQISRRVRPPPQHRGTRTHWRLLL